MTRNSAKPALENFYSFLYESEQNPNEMRRELTSMGVDCVKLEAGVTAILARANRSEKLSWLDRARKKREDFENMIEAARAALAGQFGMGMQQQAHVFFRNRNLEELSPNDMRTFVEDNHLLELLDQANSKKKHDNGSGNPGT